MLKVENLLKASLSIFFALLLMLQFLSFPGQFRYMAENEPENSYLRWPLTLLAFSVIAAIEISIICLWKLINNLSAGRELLNRKKYLTLIIFSFSYIWIILAIVWMVVVWNADDPGLPVVLTVIQCAFTVLILVFLFFRKIINKRNNLD